MSIQGDWHRRRLSRRAFLSLGGMSAAALAFGSWGARPSSGAVGYGPLVQDPAGILDLPSGFQYRIISEEGSKLSNGAQVPGDHDGMAAFQGPGDTTILVRNHELGANEGPPVVGTNPYRSSQRGGTTAIVVGSDRAEIRDYVTSSGTLNNCAGGATPWGTWLTCEETRTTDHGYVFEVMPNSPENDLSKTPIRAMGFFSHEAAGVDPATGIVYLTEDDFRGQLPSDPKAEVVGSSRVSFLYRYVPVDPSPVPGALHKGGKLQVMALEQGSYNADLASPGQKFSVVWRDVNPDEPHADAEAKGAARFNRLEGAYFAGGAFWFDDTEGGEGRLGQVFRYLPAINTLELFYEGTKATKMESPDNIVVTPWGDLWFAEDGTGRDRIMGITPDGQVYTFARNRLNTSEFAGPCFSPDGQTFFVNIQNPGKTFAVWGPFTQQSTTSQYQMALAAPPEFMRPEISGELAEAAERFGMSELEAAAYDRLGVSLV
jgi:secreted PhoX family phosphatase